MKDVEINGRKLGPGHPCFIIAEAGVNHNGSMETARRLIDVAVNARADAVKFQTFNAERLATHHAPKAAYQRQNSGPESQYEMLRRLELTEEAHRELFDYCRTQGILFMSTPFDEQSADFLDELGVPVFKIPSGELTNLPFLAHVARKSKPMIVSTGMATISEVEMAVQTIRRAGNDRIILLHCVSNYPAAAAEINLRAMLTMQMAFGVPVGYSDHTQGIAVALGSIALGAAVVEKHFTLNRSMPGPDHQASLEPQELTQLVEGIRAVTAALGDGRKEPTLSELSIAAVARRSIVATRPILTGTILTEEMIALRRPGTGLPPLMRDYVLGRRARQDIESGALLTLEVLE